MPRTKRSATSRLESRLGFSEEELTTTITIDQEALDKIEEASKEKAVVSNSIEGSNLLSPAQKSDWQKVAAENILAEMISYETISQYRAVLSEDFIEEFYINERNFLEYVKQVFDNYLAKEHINITSILICFGYESIADFIEDILSSSGSYSQVMILHEEDLEIENAYRHELSLHLMSELRDMNPENAEMGKIYLKEDGSYLVRGFDKKTIYKGSLDNLDFSSLPSKINNTFFRDHIIRNLSNRGHISSALIVCHGKGFVFKRRVGDSLKEHVFTGGDKVECFLKKLPSQSGFIEDKENVRMLIKDIVMMRPQLSEYKPPDMNIPLRVVLEKLKNQPNDFNQILVNLIECWHTAFEGRAELLEALIACDFVLKNMFCYYKNSAFMVDRTRKKLSTKFINAVQNKDLSTDLIQLAARTRTLIFNTFCKEVDKLGVEGISNRAYGLYLIARKSSDRLNQLKINGHSITAPSYQVVPPKSVDRLSGVVGAAALAINYLGRSGDDFPDQSIKTQKGHFLGVPADLYAEVSFFECVQTIYSSGWHLIYRRANRKRVKSVKVEDFKEGDFAEIYCKDQLLCTFTPQNIIDEPENVFNGVGLVVYNPDPTRIALATLILTGALAKKFKKEIYIHSDTPANSSEESSIALMYAEAILNVEAIPILIDDTKTFTLEESIKVFQALPCSEGQGSLFQDYNLTVERINREQQEDKQFLSDFGLLLSQSVDSPLLTWTKAAIVFRLTEITLFSRNLALDEFLEKMIDYMKKIAASEIFPQELRGIKKNIQKMIQSFYINQNLSASRETVGAEIFNQLAIELGSTEQIELEETKQLTVRGKKLQDKQFLNQFYAWLEKLGSCEESDYLLLWDLKTFDELNELKVLTRFRDILLSSSEMAIEKSYFLTRIKHFAKLLGLEFAESIDREDISLEELLGALILALTQRAENDKKFLSYFDNALENFPFSAAMGEGLTIVDSTGVILHETEILQRLEEISVVHHNSRKEKFIARLRRFVRKLNLHLIVSGPEGYEDKALGAKLITALELRRQKDIKFLEAFDNIFLRDTSSESRFYRFTMIDPDTQESDEQEELNEYEIASRLACIFLQHGNIDKPSFLKRFKVLSDKLNLKLPVNIDECKNEEFAKLVEDLLSDFKKKQVENKYFLDELRKTLEKSKPGKVTIKVPHTGKMLYEVDILNRLEEIAMVDRSIDEKSYQETLFLFAKTFSPELYSDVDLSSEVSALKIMEDLSRILKNRRQQDDLFVEALNRTLEDIENSQIDGYAIIMIDPNTGEKLNQHGIISRLATLFFAHGSIDRTVFIDKFERLSKNLKLKWLSEQVPIGDLRNEQAISDRELRRIVNSWLLSLKELSEQDNEFLRDLDKILRSRRLYPNNPIAIDDPKGKGILNERGILQHLKEIAIEHRTIDKITFLTVLRQFAQALPLEMQQHIDLKSISEPSVLLEKLLWVLNRRREVERPRMATGANIENVRKENSGEVLSEKEEDESLRKGRSRKTRMASARSVDEALQGFPEDPSFSAASVACYKQNGSRRSLVTNLKAEIALDPRKDWRFKESSNMTKIYDSETLVYTAGENKSASKSHVPQQPVSSLSVQDVYLEVHRHNEADVAKAVNAMAKTMQTMRKPKLEIEVVTSDPNPQEIIKQYVCLALRKNLFPEVILNGEKIPPQALYEGLLELEIDESLVKLYEKECQENNIHLQGPAKKDGKRQNPANVSTSNYGFLSQRQNVNCSLENLPSRERRTHPIIPVALFTKV